MQLIFTVNEFTTLAHIMGECESSAQAPPRLLTSITAIRQRLLARDFGFAIDELEDLEEVLRCYRDKLKGEQDSATLAERESRIERLTTLEHIIDKVEDACMMV